MSDICRERILSENFRDFIVTKTRPPVFRQLPPEQLCEQMMDWGYSSAYLETSLVEPMTIERFSYNAIPKCYALLGIEAMNQAGITSIQNYPTLQLKGEKVLLGFVDTGIDYTNPVFRNLDGTTRIAGIWDQTIQSGTTPDGIGYGTEYREDAINEALQSDDPLSVVPSRDENGHGTFLTSVAAGGGDAENQFIGAAPEADIAVVKLKEAKTYLRQFYYIQEGVPCFQENDVMLGLRYLNQLANELNLPLVMCVALGSNMGGHDGTLPLPSVLEQYARQGNRAVVVGGGNEANQRHHYAGMAQQTLEDKEVEIRVGENVDGFSMELWTDIPNIFSVTLISPSGESTRNIPIRAGASTVFHFLLEKTNVYIDYRLLVERSSSELVFFRFDEPTAGIWRIIVTPVQVAEGAFHVWLPVTEFLSGEVFFLEPSPNETLTNPGNSLAPLTVAYYNGVNQSIAIRSGRGYTRKNLIKPELAAPGVNVLGATLDQRFVRRTGSSIATAVSAGAMALLMEWVVYQRGGSGIDSVQLKSLLILGADRKRNLPYPNREWGYGTLNLYNTFEQSRRF
ncbi:S8 family peptidase [Hespellia stercorisuis]|uniref:Subtilase family protein n=1 Tax=Hespellia stercorisuis DSM 15480 TaxID=1121950 RepID=A0A1M6QCC5_9FIRM|nr:S8 family peptidase [Hespellia stercorisuis]SHK17954.1 Subtilase family protein [Hespellia stercorisuis DSM 15480]